MAQVFEEPATKRWRSVVERARKLEISDEWTEDAGKRLATSSARSVSASAPPPGGKDGGTP